MVRKQPRERQVSTSELKARCSELVRGVAARRETVIVTRRGRPVAKLVPVEPAGRGSLFGFARGTIKIRGDLIAPVDVDWEAAG
jgi:prevent-host-death family protein